MDEPGVRGGAAGPALIGVAAVAALAAITRASRPLLSGPDPFWHWDLGRRILSDGLPRTDPYSFLTDHQSWILNQWGSEATFGAVETVAGLWGLAVAASLLVGIIFLYVGWRMWKRAPSLLTVAVLGLVYVACLSNLTLRGNLFSFLLLPMLLAELLDRPRPRLPVVAGLMVVWANLHAAFLLGLVLLVVHSAAHVVVAPSGTRHSLLLERLGLISAAVLACFITPYGPRLLLQVVGLSTRGAASGITEWAPPALLEPSVLPFTALVAIVLTTTALAARRSDLPETLVIVVLALIGMTAVRNVAPASIGLGVVAAPYVVRAWATLRSGQPVSERAPRRVSRLDHLALLVILAVALGGIFALMPRTSAIAAHVRNVPLATIGELAQQDGPARVFSTSLWTPAVSILGGEGVTTSVDGRLELFTVDQFRQWRIIDNALPGWEDQLESWCMTDAVVPVDSDLADALAEHPDWRSIATHPVSGVEVDATWLSRRGSIPDCPRQASSD